MLSIGALQQPNVHHHVTAQSGDENMDAIAPCEAGEFPLSSALEGKP